MGLWIYDPEGAPTGNGSFTLVNADTDEDIRTLMDGDVISKAGSENINIRFNPVGSVGSVRFKLNGSGVRLENAVPYSIGGDQNGNYAPWSGAVPGDYTLTATPYSASGGGGTAGTPVTIHFTIETDSDECTASGTITREYWGNVSGDRVSDVPVNRTPTSTNEITIFEGPTNIGTNYATRIRGYICPPQDGTYTFWIASNDQSELWLSTDDDPANKVLIASAARATAPREWNKFASQRSAGQWLERGKRYYIEALHKQGVGTDHIAVGWSLPDGSMERPIPGSRLSPFESSGSMSAARIHEEAANESSSYSVLSIYPNPAQSGDRQLSIAGYENIGQRFEADVEIINLTGEVIYSQRVSCGGDCGSYIMKLEKNLVPGVYLVNMKTNGIKHSKRLLVK
jgi:hypothetical protein